MMIDIHLAETAIKAGDTKTGFEILRELLADDPNSERAWWIMSGLVQRDQRATCLEQVLRINPDNQFARNALKDLQDSPPKEESKPPREIPLPPPKRSAAKPKPPEVEAERKLQTWLHAQGSKFFLTILGAEHITRALTDSSMFSKVRAELKKGKIPDKLLAEMHTLPLKSISSVKKLKTGLQVFYQDGVTERSLRLYLSDQTATKKVLDVLKERLGPNFILKTQPIKSGLTLGISAILTLGAAVLTAYLFWLTQEVVSGRAVDNASVNSQFLIDMVGTLGAGGVILIGAFTLLAALAISAWLMLKPPTTTSLERRQ
jgi:hypothetical protein